MVIQLQDFCSRSIAPLQDENPLPADRILTREKVTDFAIQTTFVGLLNQLTHLSGYADEVFSSVLRDSFVFSSRIASVTTRCAHLNQLLPVLDHHHLNIRAEKMNTTARTEFHSASMEQQQLFAPSAMPQHVRNQLEKCRPPPNLSVLVCWLLHSLVSS